LKKFRMAESFDLVEQEDVALMARQFSQGAFKRKPKRGMRDSGARLGTRCGILPLMVIVGGNFFFPQAATTRVIAGVHQNAKVQVTKLDCPRKLAMLRCTFRKVFLHGVFGICRAAQNVARKILHARPMQGIQALVGTQVAG